MKTEDVQPLAAEEAAAFAAELPPHERRFLADDIALEGTDKGPRIHMTIPYNRPSEPMTSRALGEFVEVIKPTAFTKTMQEHRGSIVSLWNHNPDYVLGRPSNGTMEMRSTPDGLMADVQLDSGDPMHMSFARRVERRDVTGSSFGFDTVRAPVSRRAGAPALRELSEVRLHDISPVVFPAYGDSSAEKRSTVVLEVASVRAGVPLDDLVAALVRLEGKHFAATDAESVRGILRKLEGFLPSVPAPAIVPLSLRMRRLRLLERQHGLVTLRGMPTSTDGACEACMDACADGAICCAQTAKACDVCEQACLSCAVACATCARVCAEGDPMAVAAACEACAAACATCATNCRACGCEDCQKCAVSCDACAAACRACIDICASATAA